MRTQSPKNSLIQNVTAIIRSRSPILGGLALTAMLLAAAALAQGEPDTHNVGDYGAACDGAQDDTAAIQAAIESAALTGGNVVLPTGVCSIAGTLSVRSRVFLRGQGRGASTLHRASGSYPSDHAMLVFGDVHHAGARRLTLDGNRSGASASGGDLPGVIVRSSTDVNLEDFGLIAHDGVALSIAGSATTATQRVSVRRGLFEHLGASAIRLGSDWRNVRITDSLFRASDAEALRYTAPGASSPTSGLIFVDNSIHHASELPAIHLDAGGLTDVTLSRNIASGGFALVSLGHAILDSNVISCASGSAIALDGSIGPVVLSNNQLECATDWAISSSNSDPSDLHASIVSNRLRSDVGGVALFKGERLEIYGNVIEPVSGQGSGHGVLIQAVQSIENVVVTGNIIREFPVAVELATASGSFDTALVSANLLHSTIAGAQSVVVGPDVTNTLAEGNHEVIPETDNTPPLLTIDSPVADSTIGTTTPQITLTYSDLDSDIDTSTLALHVDGAVAGATCTFDTATAFCQLLAPLSEGVTTLSATIGDLEGNVSAPALAVFTVDSIAPGIVDTLLTSATQPSGGTTTATGQPNAAEPLTTLTATNQRTGDTTSTLVAADGSFTFQIAAEAGDVMTLMLEDSAGNTSIPALIHASVPGACNQPPDPSLIVGPEPLLNYDVFEHNRFLWEQAPRVQVDVDADALTGENIAVVHGRVLDAAGNPFPGVSVSVQDKAQFGCTTSRVDGHFNLALAGGTVLLKFERQGFLPVQRRLNLAFREQSVLKDVSMRARPTKVDIVTAGSPAVQVARGVSETDASGERQATLLLPENVTAQLSMPDGTMQPATDLSLRIREFTVGETGRQAMPGTLPTMTGYTYAFDASADEADSAGADSIVFSEPVYHYVENYLDFPVGGAIPAGYYDEKQGAWLPGDDGLVVGILPLDANGLAEIDIDGSGQAADAIQLADLGFTDAERAKLAELYAPGDEIWRHGLAHLSTWDFNPSFGLPLDFLWPPETRVSSGGSEDCDDEEAGSIIECQSQILRTSIPLAGTPFSLHYNSERTRGRQVGRRLEIQLTPDETPESMLFVVLELEVAGRPFRWEFPNLPNQSYTFTWDGQDAHGRDVYGEVFANGRVGYVYQPVYRGSNSSEGRGWGLPGDLNFTLGPARQPYTVWRDFEATLKTLFFSEAEGPLGLGWSGWSLTPQHAHTTSGRHSGHIYHGDGTDWPWGAGTIDTLLVGTPEEVFIWQSGAWVQIQMAFPAQEGLAVDDAGNIYFAFGSVFKRTPEGDIYRIAGGGTSWDDGIPAVDSRLDRPRSLEVGADGSIYIAEFNRDRVRRVRPDGIIETITNVVDPLDVSLSPEGVVFVATASGADRILRVDPRTGVTATYAGGNSAACSQTGRGDGGPASNACLVLNLDQTGIAWMADGSLLIPEGWTGNSSKVRRVTPTGFMTTFLGGDGTPGHPTYGQHYSNSSFWYPKRVAVDPSSGAIAIIDFSVTLGSGRLTLIEPDGVVLPGAAPSAAQVDFALNGDLVWASDPLHTDSALYLRELDQFRMGDGSFVVGSTDASQLFTFDETGRHLQTIDASTGDLVFQFNYDSNGLLLDLEDRYGLKVTVERDGGGTPTSVVAPHGQQTALVVDSEDNLVSVSSPGDETFSMEYGNDGLLTRMTGPRGFATDFAYDSLGRLVSDVNAKGGGKTLTRTPGIGDYAVTFSSSEGRTTLFDIGKNNDGTQNRTKTEPAGVVTQTLLKKDLSSRVTKPDGTIVDLSYGPDPRFGAQSPVPQSLSITTPGGLTRFTTTQRTATFNDPNGSPRDPSNLATLEERLTVNGKAYTSLYTASTRTWLTTSPEGRTTATTLNAQGEVEAIQSPGLAPITMLYDAHGRPKESRAGAGTEERVVTYDYNLATGWLDSVTDPEQQMAAWQRDPVGRPTTTQYPDSRELDTNYDDNGNLVSLDPPGQPAHTFTHDEVNMPDTYQPPSGPAEAYAFDLDQQPLTITRPSGETIAFVRDSTTRRLSQIDTDTDDHSFVYVPNTNQVQSISHWPEGYGEDTPQTLTYSYDGFLPTSTTWSGQVAGTVTHTFDEDFRLSAQLVNGAWGVAYVYNNDDLLTQVGSLQIVRDPAVGWIEATTVGVVETSQGYNQFGEMNAFEATTSASPVFSASYVHDKLGRITQKTETIQGTTAIYDYAYDSGGRLDTVYKDTVLVEDYGYDDNDNRVSYDGTFGPASGTYDSQDRLESYGGLDYTFDADGFLTTKTDGVSTTTFDYDAMGSLRQVVFETGVTIGYTVDGQNRRVGKSVNGVPVQGFLYQDQLNPAAELDGAGNVVGRFVYGARGHVPDFMVKGASTYRLISDHLGSVRLSVDAATGAVAQRLDYDSFGRVIFDSNPGFQPFGFAGGLYEPPTGLVRFGARDFDPVVGRWTAKDPIGFAAGDSNLYGYVFDDPVNLLDPLGLDALQDVSDFSAGFGDTISFGGSRKIRQWMGIDHIINFCSGYFTAGQVAGVLHGIAMGAAGTLYGGARSVFFSGHGSFDAAIAAKGAGRMITDTLGGRILSRLGASERVWRLASVVFAANAKGTAQAFLRFPLRSGNVFIGVEVPTMARFANPWLVFR